MSEQTPEVPQELIERFVQVTQVTEEEARRRLSAATHDVEAFVARQEMWHDNFRNEILSTATMEVDRPSFFMHAADILRIAVRYSSGGTVSASAVNKILSEEPFSSFESGVLSDVYNAVQRDMWVNSGLRELRRRVEKYLQDQPYDPPLNDTYGIGILLNGEADLEWAGLMFPYLRPQLALAGKVGFFWVKFPLEPTDPPAIVRGDLRESTEYEIIGEQKINHPWYPIVKL